MPAAFWGHRHANLETQQYTDDFEPEGDGLMADTATRPPAGGYQPSAAALARSARPLLQQSSFPAAQQDQLVQLDASEWRQTSSEEATFAAMLRTTPPASRVANRLFVSGAATPATPAAGQQPVSPTVTAGRRATVSPDALAPVRGRAELEAELNKLRQEVAELKAHGGPSSFSIAPEELDMGEQVGGGGYSLVYRGLWRGTPVAIKKWFNPDHTEEVMAEFRGEVMTHEVLRHPNVVQFLGACMKPPNLCLVMEHMPHSLHSILYTSGVEVDRKRIVQLALEVVHGMAYLHSRRPPVVHRDIKPANFLVDRAWHVKICDFGLATNTKSQRGAGTLPYMAPELLQRGPYNDRVDVYAFGVMLNEMDTRRVPWDGLSAPEIKDKVLAGDRPDTSLSCPRALMTIIRACWAQSAAARPSFDQVSTMLQELADSMKEMQLP